MRGWGVNRSAEPTLGSVAAAVVGGLLPETLKTRAPEPLSLLSTMRLYRTFMKNRAFLAHLARASSVAILA